MGEKDEEEEKKERMREEWGETLGKGWTARTCVLKISSTVKERRGERLEGERDIEARNGK